MVEETEVSKHNREVLSKPADSSGVTLRHETLDECEKRMQRESEEQNPFQAHGKDEATELLEELENQSVYNTKKQAPKVAETHVKEGSKNEVVAGGDDKSFQLTDSKGAIHQIMASGADLSEAKQIWAKLKDSNHIVDDRHMANGMVLDIPEGINLSPKATNALAKFSSGRDVV
jgi:hypothetical protein